MSKKIPLTKGKVAIVDDEDYEWLVNKYTWYYSCGYALAYAGGGRKNATQIQMHRLVNETPEGKQTDHINGNTLDNRKKNLRTATNSQNMANMRPGARGGTSQYKGVYYVKGKGVWRAQIQCNKKRYNIGDFKTEKAAAQAYDKKAMELFGEYAAINLPAQLNFFDGFGKKKVLRNYEERGLIR